MYDYIVGEIISLESGYIVIDNNNVGYKIFVSNPYSFNIGEKNKVFIYQYVREDEMSLYGFKNVEDRDLFLKLINVKGLGPKTALPMFANGGSSALMDAIESENINYLKKMPKIGEKAARQIILDLKGKLAPKVEKNINSELSDALKALGYKQADISKVIGNVNGSDTIENQIKEALKLLLK